MNGHSVKNICVAELSYYGQIIALVAIYYIMLIKPLVM